MNDELQALEKTHTWDYVDLPPGKRSIDYKWIYKIKTHSDGTIERYKTRLIPKGYSQEYGIDYEETFALVARMTSVRSLLAVAAAKQWPLLQMDVKNAFLNGTLSEEVYMKPPPGTSSPPHKPLDPNVHLTPYDGVPLEDVTLYRQLVGSLIYLTVTRPDIAYAVHIVSQFMAAPRTIHFTAVLRILRYVKGTLGHGLQFSSQSSLVLSGYSDADWAGDPTDRRSKIGYCFYLGDSLICWRSKKHNVVSRSSTELEYRALADTTAEQLWLH
ncbi:hypothetical protein IC582_013904 [Cucumis melo]